MRTRHGSGWVWMAAWALVSSSCSSDPAGGTVSDGGLLDAGETADAAAEADVRTTTDDSGAADLSPNADPDPGAPDAGRPSPCERSPEAIACEYSTATLDTGFTGLVPRDVHYVLPVSSAPASGHPVVLLFQGSLFSAELSFSASEDDPFGAIHQTRLVAELVDRGYAVLAPEAHLDGSTYWDTNVPPYSLAWDTAPDHRFMLDIFAGIGAGEFGDLDPDAMFATGISSGGYMTSRMAVSYPGQFRALAINAGSYATCSGALCVVPDLPTDHPPTLFVTGEADAVVPLSTVERYHEKLQPITETELVTNQTAGHEYTPEAPVHIPDWFDRYR